MKIGITGQSGFIGSHLYNTLGLFPEKFERVPFEDCFFEQESKLEAFVKNCDVIVHLAAMNRHENPQVIYDTNVLLVKSLIKALEKTGSRPHVIFSSSTQEEKDNLYGKSKKEGRHLLNLWADKNNVRFSGLVIPNVFGPFGLPYYNSVVATFCYQFTHGEEPKIEIDGELKLIYVAELAHKIVEIITPTTLSNKPSQAEFGYYHNENSQKLLYVNHTAVIKVSTLLNKLRGYKNHYFDQGVLPKLDDPFDRNLFITFLCYIDHVSFFPFNLKLNTDQRGSFVETVKLNSGGQVSFSTTKPGITRGNHFHTRKAERFAVIKGKAKIQLRKIGTNQILDFYLDGEHPSFVDMPVWYTHNLSNIGNEDLYTIFWINELYDPNDPDTFFEPV